VDKKTYKQALTLAQQINFIERPVSYSAFPEYQQGWNHCSNGGGIADNPYAEDCAPLSKWNMWNNGFSDYSGSQFNCRALALYNRYLHNESRDYLTELLSVFGAQVAEEIREDDFFAVKHSLQDGSCIVVSQKYVYVETKSGVVFVSRRLPELADV
jgi:hypothetical protein